MDLERVEVKLGSRVGVLGKINNLPKGEQRSPDGQLSKGYSNVHLTVSHST